MKYLLRAITYLMLFAAGMLAGFGLLQREIAPPVQYEAGAVSVFIDTEAASGYIQTVDIIPGDTVGSALAHIADTDNALTLTTDDYGSLGTLVTGINEFKNGTNDKYWQYWVNNVYATRDAFSQPVFPGDVIVWKFTKTRFNQL